MKFFKILYPFFILFLALFSSCGTTKKTAKADNILEVPMREVTIVANPPYKGFTTKYFKLIHTELDLKPDWKNRYLYGKAVLTLTPYAYPQDSIVIDAVGFVIKDISVGLGAKNNDSKPEKNRQAEINYSKLATGYSYDNKKIHIGLKTKNDFQPGMNYDVRIEYIARPDTLVKMKLIKKEDLAGLFFINPDNKDSLEPRELWTQGETQSNSCWFPTIDAPDQKMSQRIKLTVDSQYITLSNGALTSSTKNTDGTRTDVWEQELPHSPYLTMIAAGPWKIIHDSWQNAVPVNYYLEKEYAPYAKMVFGNTPEMINYYSKLLNYNYPWDKYSQIVCREYDGGAMENTGAVVFFEKMHQDSRTHLDEDLEDVVSHELFHHWFGDLVTCESWANICLNESFATFGEYLWTEHKYGRQSVGYSLNEDLHKYLDEARYHLQPIVYHYYYDQEDLFDRTRYQKGGLALVMLRHYLGDKVFFGALHNYLITYAFKTAEIADLRHAFEDASGEDLNWFFNEWFEKPGHPVFSVAKYYDETRHQLNLFVSQNQKDPSVPFFKMPVDIDIYLPGNEVIHKKIWVTNKSDSFSFRTDKKPLFVNFDASKTLICEKNEYKSPEEWYYGYFHTPLFQDRLGAVNALFQTKDLMNDSALKAMNGQIMHNYKISINDREKGHAGLLFGLEKDSLTKLLFSVLADSAWSIRQAAIGIIEKDIPSEHYSEYKGYIHQMATNDPKASVRAAALGYISEMEKGSARDVYEKALLDSSYHVVATGLECLSNILSEKDSLAILKNAKICENLVHSPEILLKVAKIYSRYGNANKLPFMHKAFKHIPNNQQYEFIISYEAFIKKNGWQLIEKDTDFISLMESRATSFLTKLSYKEMLRRMGEDLQKKKDGIHDPKEITRLDILINFLQKRRDSLKFEE